MQDEIYNDYLLVMPSGNCKGFNDLESVMAYTNTYYEQKVDSAFHKDGYNDCTEIGSDGPRKNIFTQLGVKEGRCQVYKTEDFIQKLKEDLVFDDEKEEIIPKLCEQEIHFNIYDYSLDKSIADIEEINIMESLGDKMSD